MNIHKYILLLLLCLIVVYYNIFMSIYIFNFVEIKSIKIIKSNNTINTHRNIFKAKLQNKNKCIINIKNEVMIKNFIKNMKKYNIKYYTVVQNKNNICSKPEKNIDIIFYNILFYCCTLISFVIFFIIFTHVYFEYNISLNEIENNNFNI